MDNSDKELDYLRSCVENMDASAASDVLSEPGFVAKRSRDVIRLLGEQLTEENYKNEPVRYGFCEEQLLKVARSAAGCVETVVDFFELIDEGRCRLQSSVSAAVALLENVDSPSDTFLEYLLHVTLAQLLRKTAADRADCLLDMVHRLARLKKHFRHRTAVLSYFAGYAFAASRAAVDPVACARALSDAVEDPFCLLEVEPDGPEDRLHVASFVYLRLTACGGCDDGWWWCGPKVYDRFYVLNRCARLAMSVFGDDDLGKPFAKLVLDRFDDDEIPLRALDAVHAEFCAEAARDAVYRDRADARRTSIDALTVFVRKLSADAGHAALRRLFASPDVDTGVKSHLLVAMKDALVARMRRPDGDLGGFRGRRLLDMIRLCCGVVPDSSEWLIVEHHPYVLACTSFLRGMHAFLTADHHSGFADMLNVPVAEFRDVAARYVATVQCALDRAVELCAAEDGKLERRVNAAPADDHDDDDDDHVPAGDKRTILLSYNTGIRLMQLNLNALKEEVVRRTETKDEQRVP